MIDSTQRRKAADHLYRLSALAHSNVYDPDKHTMNFDVIEGCGWSSGEEVLIDTMLFLLDIGQKCPSLREVFYQLDDENRQVVIEALRMLNGYEPALS